MHFRPIALLALFLLPSVAFGAGFAKQSLFLSKSPVVEGDSVLIHTVVSNDAGSAFKGEVVFSSQQGSDAKVKIGSAAATIAPQGALAVSVSWAPLAGDYTVTADLTGSDGTVVESESAHFTINPKPKPASSDTSSDGLESSADVEKLIAQYVPMLAGASHPVFDTIDSWRATANNFLDSGINWSKSKVGTAPTPGEVLGAATKDTSPQGLLWTASYIAGTIALYFFTVLKWIITHTGVFYPVIAIGFLFALWRIFAGIRRPRY